MLSYLLGFSYMIVGSFLIYYGMKGIKKQKELSKRDLLLLSFVTVVITFSIVLASIIASR